MNQEQAKQLVRARLRREIDEAYVQRNEVPRKRAYISDRELTNLDVIHTVYGDIPLPRNGLSGSQERVWVAFVDDDPEANWAHSCRYLVINEEGMVWEYPSTRPPSERNPFSLEGVLVYQAQAEISR
jgi:hypothetical protein